MKRSTTLALVALPLALGLGGLAGCSPSSQSAAPVAAGDLGISDDGYTLDKLVEAAKKEGPITVADTTGKIEDQAKAFSEKYGIEVTGTKLKGQQQIEIAQREAKAKNVQTDVFFNTSPEVITSQLIPDGTVVSWMPPDLTDQVDEDFQDPLMVTEEPVLYMYNTESYPDGCPIDDIWDLVDGEFKGKVALPDPTLSSYMTNYFDQMREYQDDAVSQAYEDHFGKKLETDEESATDEWVKQLAASGALATKSNDDVADAIGAPGQDAPFVGLSSAAKMRDNDDKGYKLGVCRGMEPETGFAYPKSASIAAGTDSPNAAKLFVHYMLTEEGILPQTTDGKISTNTTVPKDETDPSKVADYWDEIFVLKTENFQNDYDTTTDWVDFWRMNAS